MSSKILFWGCSLNIFVIVFVFVFPIVFCWSGHVFSDQMSQRSKVQKIVFWRCSLNVFVFLLVRWCFVMTPISFVRFFVWSGRPKGFESNTMTKQLVTKVGLELLGQLKIQIRMGIAQIAIWPPLSRSDWHFLYPIWASFSTIFSTFVKLQCVIIITLSLHQIDIMQ